jgi:hypothetical protein
MQYSSAGGRKQAGVKVKKRLSEWLEIDEDLVFHEECIGSVTANKLIEDVEEQLQDLISNQRDVNNVLTEIESDVKNFTKNVDWYKEESIQKVPQYTQGERQIASMRYCPKRKFFYGRTVTAVLNGRRQYTEECLTHEWVSTNISQEFQDVLKARSTSTGYLFIPTGNANSNRPYPYTYNTVYPKIMYQQGERNTCATSSIASLLHHLGFEDTAKWIEDFGKEFVEDSTKDQHRIMQQLISHIRQSNPDFTSNWDVQKIKNTEFDIWNDDEVLVPKLLQILGSDGGVGHALTIYNGLIFDSNLEYAVDLTRLNLEFCIDAVYEGIVFGYKFLQKKKQTKSKKRRGKQRDRVRQQRKLDTEKKRKRSEERNNDVRKRQKEDNEE